MILTTIFKLDFVQITKDLGRQFKIIYFFPFFSLTCIKSTSENSVQIHVKKQRSQLIKMKCYKKWKEKAQISPKF